MKHSCCHGSPRGRAAGRLSQADPEALWAGWGSGPKARPGNKSPGQTELTYEMTPSKVTAVNTNTSTENASPLGPSLPSRNNTIFCLSVWLNASFFLGGRFHLACLLLYLKGTPPTQHILQHFLPLVVTQLMRKIGIAWNHSRPAQTCPRCCMPK